MAAERSIIPVFDMALTKGVCDVLAQTDYPGLSNREINDLLQMINISSREPGGNKRESLYITLNNIQVKQKAGNALAAFLTRAMAPARYARDPERFGRLRDELNEFLVHYGYRIRDDGKLAKGAKASNLTEAAKLAGQLHTELRRRGTHAELYRYCGEEFVNRSLFHAITEAAKSISDRVRTLTGLAGDGAALYDGVFGTRENQPTLYINALTTDSEISEHRGFKNLPLGIHGHFRNPRAHTNRVNVEEQLPDFYDAMALFSYVHRRLDGASRTPFGRPAG